MLSALRAVLLLALLLTVPTVGAQTRPSFQAGAHGGFDFTEGEVDNERLGVQASVPVGWLLTLDPVFSYLYNFPGDPTDTFEGSAWQGYLTLRVHPWSFLALGYGMTVIHASLSSAEFDFSDSETDATDVGWSV